MKIYYCWRCRTEVPMLEEHEWQEILPLLKIDIKSIKEYRQQYNCDLSTATAAVGHKACKKYKELTGYNETNHVALYHHRLSLSGPECKRCGHLFRTPNASYCANCGLKAINDA